jgi:hypothetical protein
MVVSDEEWGPWIEHDGKGCPCVGAVVWVRLGPDAFGGDPADDGGPWHPGWTPLSNIEGIGIAAVDDIGWLGGSEDEYSIAEYRIRRPKALRDLIQRARELDDAPEGPTRTPVSPKVMV